MTASSREQPASLSDVLAANDVDLGSTPTFTAQSPYRRADQTAFPVDDDYILHRLSFSGDTLRSPPPQETSPFCRSDNSVSLSQRSHPRTSHQFLQLKTLTSPEQAIHFSPTVTFHPNGVEHGNPINYSPLVGVWTADSLPPQPQGGENSDLYGDRKCHANGGVDVFQNGNNQLTFSEISPMEFSEQHASSAEAGKNEKRLEAPVDIKRATADTVFSPNIGCYSAEDGSYQETDLRARTTTKYPNLPLIREPQVLGSNTGRDVAHEHDARNTETIENNSRSGRVHGLAFLEENFPQRYHAFDLENTDAATIDVQRRGPGGRPCKGANGSSEEAEILGGFRQNIALLPVFEKSYEMITHGSRFGGEQSSLARKVLTAKEKPLSEERGSTAHVTGLNEQNAEDWRELWQQVCGENKMLRNRLQDCEQQIFLLQQSLSKEIARATTHSKKQLNMEAELQSSRDELLRLRHALRKNYRGLNPSRTGYIIGGTADNKREVQLMREALAEAAEYNAELVEQNESLRVEVHLLQDMLHKGKELDKVCSTSEKRDLMKRSSDGVKSVRNSKTNDLSDDSSQHAYSEDSTDRGSDSLAKTSQKTIYPPVSPMSPIFSTQTASLNSRSTPSSYRHWFHKDSECVAKLYPAEDSALSISPISSKNVKDRNAFPEDTSYAESGKEARRRGSEKNLQTRDSNLTDVCTGEAASPQRSALARSNVKTQATCLAFSSQNRRSTVCSTSGKNQGGGESGSQSGDAERLL